MTEQEKMKRAQVHDAHESAIVNAFGIENLLGNQDKISGFY